MTGPHLDCGPGSCSSPKPLSQSLASARSQQPGEFTWSVKKPQRVNEYAAGKVESDPKLGQENRSSHKEKKQEEAGRRAMTGFRVPCLVRMHEAQQGEQKEEAEEDPAESTEQRISSCGGSKK